MTTIGNAAAILFFLAVMVALATVFGPLTY